MKYAQLLLVGTYLLHTAWATALHLERIGSTVAPAISSVIEDSQGFLWIATQAGLLRFDAYDLVAFPNTLEPNNSDANDFLGGVIGPNQRLLWLATRHGWYQFDTITHQFSQSTALKSMNGVPFEITASPSSDYLWVATANYRLYRYNMQTDELQIYPFDEINLPTNEMISTIDLYAVDDQLWIASNNTIIFHRDDSDKFQTIELRDESGRPLDVAVTSLYFSQQAPQKVWISSETQGIFYSQYDEASPFSRVQKMAKQDEKYSQSGSYQAVMKRVCPESPLTYVNTFFHYQGQLKASSPHHGVYEWDATSECFVPQEINWLADIKPRLLSPRGYLTDRRGRLWITTADGVYFHDPNHQPLTIRTARDKHWATTDAKKQTYFALSVFEDSIGGRWIATLKNGLYRYDHQLQHFEHFPGNAHFRSGPGVRFKGDKIRKILEDQTKTLWFGTNKGLSLYDLRLDESSTPGERGHPELDAFQYTIKAMAFDKDGNLWFNMNQGLGHYDFKTKTLTRFVHRNDDSHSLAHNSVFDILVTEKGEVWVATGNGLSHLTDFNKKQFRHYLKDNQSQALKNLVLTLLDDGERLWFGRVDGVYRLHKSSGDIRHFRSPFGYENNMTHSISHGLDNDLWITTNNGLNRFHKNTDKYSRYTENHGLPSDTFVTHASAKLKNGDLLLGTVKGWAQVTPITHGDVVPRAPVVASVKTPNGSDIHYAIPNEPLSSGTQVIEIALTTFDFGHTDNIDYRYRMNPSGSWQYLERANRLTLYDLSPGQYALEIQSSRGGEWQQVSTDVAFEVLPFWWQTWWARLSTLACVIALFVLWYYRKVKQWRVRHQELEACVEERTHQLVERNEKIEQLLAERDTWITNITHEFKTPLSLILAPIRHARTVGSGLSKRDLSMVERNANRLLRLIEQFLALSPSEHRQHVTSMVVDIKERTALLVAELESLAAEKNLHLSFETTNSTLGVIHADIQLFDTIILNLLSNAIKYTNPHGSIRVSGKVEAESKVVLSVQDSGIGIPESHLEKIFERFKRVDSNEHRERAGAGIGLALVKSLVTSLGGQIKVISQEGVGSIFTVILPLSTQVHRDETGETGLIGVNQEGATWASNTAWLQQEKSVLDAHVTFKPEFQATTWVTERPSVLLIEDNVELLGYLVEQLSKHFNVATAENGQIGIDLARKTIPDLIISDVLMPEKNGFEVVEVLKQDPATDHIPMILLTALNQSEHKIHGYEIQADAYLIKPFDVDELTACVTSLLQVRETLKKRFSHQLKESRLTTECATSHSEAGMSPPSSIDAFIERVDEVLEAEYQTPDFSVQKLSEALYLSDRQLRRKLNALTDMTPTEYLRCYRINKSIPLISQRKTLTHVAEEVGFQSYPYFVKCFKSIHGMTPSEFREHNRGTVS